VAHALYAMLGLAGLRRRLNLVGRSTGERRSRRW
jgi:hypothetical protein